MHVNGIVYQEGTNDRLYIATDAGVYVKDNSQNSWVKYGNIPNVRVTEVRINECFQKITAATFGRGIWEADLLPPNDMEITSTSTWPANKTLSQNLRVKNNSTLTITGTVNMPKGSKIIVERGSQLIVTGTGKITNSCNQSWKGIELWGNRTARQLSTTQGKVQVNSGGIIENAEIGINTIKKNTDGTDDWNYTGGIVQCNSGIFRNCQKAVAFLSYQNTNASGQPINNISSFIKCTFERTPAMISPPVTADALVSMYDVNGIFFSGSTFRNTNTSFTSMNKGKGIYGIDAGFIVQDYCNVAQSPCPLASIVHCTFNGLTYGAHVENVVSGLRNANVANATFTNVERGVLCKAGSYHNVAGNTFTGVPSGQGSGSGQVTYGIRMEGATNFIVSGNSLTGVGSPPVNNFGIIVENSGSTASEVKLNSHNNFYAGTQTQQSNGSGTTGLKISCNSYNTYYRYAWNINPAGGGTLANQGEGCAGTVKQAGNTWNYSNTQQYNQINSTVPFSYYAGNLPNLPVSYFNPIMSPNNCGIYNSGSCSSGGGGGGSLMAEVSSIDKKSRGGADEGEKLRDLNEQIRQYLAEDNMQAAIQLLEADNSPASQKTLAETYLLLGNYAKAKSLFTEVANSKTYDTEYETMFTNIYKYLSTGKKMNEADNALIFQLKSFSASRKQGGYQAQALLSFAGAEKRECVIEYSREEMALQRKKAETGSDPAQHLPLLGDNYPNPFSEITSITAYIPEENVNVHLVVYTLTGQEITRNNLSKGENKVEINTSGIQPGIYLYSLVKNGEKLITKRMTIIKQ